jgi:predicted MFS family arabinose efflux permease
MLSFKIYFQNRKYFAPAFLYSCFSLVFSTWVTYIPYIADKLHITEGKIGGALFFTSLGALTMLPVSNRLVYKIGVGRQAFIGFVCYAISMYGMFLAPSYVYLCASLYCFGMMSSVFSISLNSLMATIEKQEGKNIMTGGHGFWSIGGMIGSATGSFIAGLLKMPFVHITILVTLLIIIEFWLRKEYIHIRSEHYGKEKHSKFPIKPLLAIVSISVVLMVSEGAIADWSALYMKKIVLMKGQYLGLGYSLFSVGMASGRFVGDALSQRFGSWKLLRMSIGTSLVGFTLVLLSSQFSALLGFLIIGLGFSIVVPEVYRLASRIKGVNTADGISFISAASNIGFLTGPVILGLIAEAYTLHASFMFLMACIFLVFILSFRRK